MGCRSTPLPNTPRTPAPASAVGHGEERGVVVAVDDGLAVGQRIEVFAEGVARSHEKRQMGELILRERVLSFGDAAARDDGKISVIGAA